MVFITDTQISSRFVTHNGCGQAFLNIAVHFPTLATLPQLLEGTFHSMYLGQD